MSVRLSCPSCNTAFTLPALPANRRAACPRCGDVFPVRGEVIEDDTPASLPDAHQPPAAGHARGMWSVRRTAVVALTLGLLGLAAGLAAYSIREPRPKPEPPPEPPAAVNAVPPAQLAGLGYLPPECNMLFAVQPGPLLAYATRTAQEPRALLTRAGVPPPVLAALDQVGLTLPQIDHIAGGVFIGGEGDELRVALALVLKQPLADEDAFLAKLKAKPGKKARYTVELGRLPVNPLLACVSPTVWLFGLNDKDFAATKSEFGAGVRQMLAAVPPDAAAWAVADDDRDWAQKPLVKLAAQSPEAKKWLPALSGFRGGLFALTISEQPRMRLFIRTADTPTADRVRAYFQARAAEVDAATAGGGGVLALFDAPFDPALLARFAADAAK